MLFSDTLYNAIYCKSKGNIDISVHIFPQHMVANNNQAVIFSHFFLQSFILNVILLI